MLWPLAGPVWAGVGPVRVEGTWLMGADLQHKYPQLVAWTSYVTYVLPTLNSKQPMLGKRCPTHAVTVRHVNNTLLVVMVLALLRGVRRKLCTSVTCRRRTVASKATTTTATTATTATATTTTTTAAAAAAATTTTTTTTGASRWSMRTCWRACR